MKRCKLILPDPEAVLELSSVLRAVIMSTNLDNPPVSFLSVMAAFLSGSWTAFQRQLYRFRQSDGRFRTLQESHDLHDQLQNTVDRLQSVEPDEMPTYSDCSFLDGDKAHECLFETRDGRKLQDIHDYHRSVVLWIFQIVRISFYLDPSLLAPFEDIYIDDLRRSTLNPFDQDYGETEGYSGYLGRSNAPKARKSDSKSSKNVSARPSSRLGGTDRKLILSSYTLKENDRAKAWSQNTRLSMADITRSIAIDFGEIELLEALKWSPERINDYSKECTNNPIHFY